MAKQRTDAAGLRLSSQFKESGTGRVEAWKVGRRGRGDVLAGVQKGCSTKSCFVPRLAKKEKERRDAAVKAVMQGQGGGPMNIEARKRGEEFKNKERRERKKKEKRERKPKKSGIKRSQNRKG